MTRRILMGVIVAALAWPGVAAAQSAPAGSFALEAHNGAQLHRGTIRVTPSGGGFEIQGRVGADQLHGVAVLANGMLSIGYSLAGSVGVALLAPDRDSWSGSWLIAGEPGGPVRLVPATDPQR